MQKTIVTILSTNYSGSHFLSLVLGSHSRACHIGEVRHAASGAKYASGAGLCQLCAEPKNCPTVRNLNTVDVRSVYDTVFENLAADGIRPRMLVDNSKKLTWARNFLGDDTYRYKYIHLIRDPRALVRRYLMNYQTVRSRFHVRRKVMLSGDRLRPALLFRPEWEVCLYKWYDQNVAITKFLRENACDSQVVTYRDLATNTAQELKHLVPWLDLEFEPKQIEYWMFDHHGTQKVTYEWIKQQRETGHFDVRWKESLAPDIAEAIVQNRDVRRLLDRLSLAFTETGLTRKASAASDQVPFAAPSRWLWRAA